MEKVTKKTILGLALSLALANPALAAGFFTNGLPPAGGTQYPGTLPLTGLETIPADTNLTGGQNPASESISTGQLAQYVGSAGSNSPNLLIGGDAGTNLWQRGTTGSSVTTTTTYGGPDRFAYWSGTNTAMTVSRDSAATDVPSGFGYAFKVARTAGQTGVVPVCVEQALQSSWAISLAGQTVEFDFNAYTGATFSAAGANVTAYVVTGTGTDESAAKLAYGINAGGGGGSAWAGQANATAAVISLGGVSTAGRYAAVANIPATATQVGVAICWTPVGTAGANDYVALAGLLLKRSPGLANYANATTGYVASAIGAASFLRKAPADEAQLQQMFYYQVTESAAIFPVGVCSAVDTTHTNCFVKTPVSMRVAPTLTFATGFASPTSTTQATLGACTALAATATVASTVASPDGFLVNCTATTIPAAGVASFLYSNGGTGKIQASAEL